MFQKLLLICGILSSPLYIGTDILGGILLEGYDFVSQYISELSAIGAPSRSLVIPLYIAYDILMIAFGIGVWTAASRKNALRLTGGMLIGFTVVGLVGLLFPMHPRGVEATFTDTIHQIVAGVTVVFILLTIGSGATRSGATAYGKRFRLYSIGTLLILLVLGVIPFLSATQVVTGNPTPWVGLIERVIAYIYLLWVMILAIVIFRAEKRSNLINRNEYQLNSAMGDLGHV
jgi:heme A synthase